MERQTFIKIRNEYLTSATPINSPEYLRGRQRALSSLVDALGAPGRHAFIYGYRGVGKTSLAQTAAHLLQASVGVPILTSCDKESTFSVIAVDIIRQALQISPLERKGQTRLNLGASFTPLGGLNFGIERNPQNPNITVSSVSDAVLYLKETLRKIGIGIIVVIDEFDQLKSPAEHNKFASFVKQISDQRIDCRLIFCGIADTVEKLFSEHESIFRQIHSEKVDRLQLQARVDIIEAASAALDIKINSTFKYRIAQISDGFPSFVHLISEKVFTKAFDNENGEVSRTDYEEGIREAITSVEVTLRRNYENALHRNTKKYEHAIWALASDKLLEVNYETIKDHYVEICKELKIEPVSMNNLNTKLNQLCTDQYGPLLVKPRRSNYTFLEKMMRAYSRLRAEDAGIELGKEAP